MVSIPLQLALLKELTDLLLREGLEVIIQQLAGSRKGKTSKKKQATDYPVSIHPIVLLQDQTEPQEEEVREATEK